MRRDPVDQTSNLYLGDMNVMAESIADSLGKEDKVSVRRMNSFAIDALRGFGEYIESHLYPESMANSLLTHFG